MQRDSLLNTLVVSLALCILCSLIVSVSAVGLRSFQDANKVLDQKRNIISAASLAPGKKTNAKEVDKLFERIEKRVIDLSTGEYVDPSVIDPNAFDQRKAAKDPSTTAPVAGPYSTGISTREKYSLVYLIKSESDPSKVEQVVFPVYGKGLWSTLYGFIALGTDFNTVKGLTFYEHAETPGLGGEVDNPNWKQQWVGKKIYDPTAVGSTGGLKVNVARSTASEAAKDYEVDGLSGATITSRGVSNLLRYWFSDEAFGKFIQKQQEGKANG